MNDDERARRIQAHYARLASQTQRNAPFWLDAYTLRTEQSQRGLAQIGYSALAQVYRRQSEQ
jgi:hypothetical protein